MLTGSTNIEPTGSNDLWEYDQTTNTWTQKANIPVTGTFLASGFSIGLKGYLLVDKSNFWEYDSETDVWTQKANIGISNNIDRAGGISINGKGYLGGIGQNNEELWEYTPPTNAWKYLGNIPSGERSIPIGFSIGNLLYIGTGYGYRNGDVFKKDFWEVNPSNLTLSINSISKNENQNNLYSIFPNPANELINISVDNSLIDSTYSIFDLLGKELTTGKLLLETTLIGINDFKPGIYFIRIIKDKTNLTFKILKV